MWHDSSCDILKRGYARGYSLFVVRDEIFFVGIDDKDGQQACRLSLAVICADGMMVTR